MNLDLIFIFLYSYLLGAIPFGLIVTKIFLNKDVRKIGSGNIGATNVLRTGKKSLALLTLTLDLLKGYFSVYVTSLYFSDFIFFVSLVCFIGHIFPIWLKFKGGKGVATYLGIILAISFDLGIIFGLSWLIILFIFKFSSLSSIISTFLVFIYSLFLDSFSLSSFLLIIFIIVIYTHKENILRIKNKKENKINL